MIAKKVPLKKSPVISKEIIEQVASIETPKIIPNMFMGASNQIPVSNTYVASDGDIVKIGMFNNTRVVEIEMCSASLEQIEQLSMYATDDEKTSTITRRPKVKVNDNMIELCEISLGHYRNCISRITDIEKTIIGKRTYYDKSTGLRKEKDTGNTIFKTILMCDSANEAIALNMLKNIFKQYSKISVEWFV